MTSVAGFWVVVVGGTVLLTLTGISIALYKRESMFIKSRGLSVIIGSAVLATLILVLVTSPLASIARDIGGVRLDTPNKADCVAWVATDILLTSIFAVVSFNRLFRAYFKIGLNNSLMRLNDLVSSTHYPTLRVNIESADDLLARYSVRGQISAVTQDPEVSSNLTFTVGSIGRNRQLALFTPLAKLSTDAPEGKSLAWFIRSMTTYGNNKWFLSRMALPAVLACTLVPIMGVVAYFGTFDLEPIAPTPTRPADTTESVLLQCENVAVAFGGPIHILITTIFVTVSAKTWGWVKDVPGKEMLSSSGRLDWLYDRSLVLWELAVHWVTTIISCLVAAIAYFATDTSFRGGVLVFSIFIRIFCVTTIATGVLLPVFLSIRHDITIRGFITGASQRAEARKLQLNNNRSWWVRNGSELREDSQMYSIGDEQELLGVAEGDYSRDRSDDGGREGEEEEQEELNEVRFGSDSELRTIVVGDASSEEMKHEQEEVAHVESAIVFDKSSDEEQDSDDDRGRDQEQNMQSLVPLPPPPPPPPPPTTMILNRDTMDEITEFLETRSGRMALREYLRRGKLEVNGIALCERVWAMNEDDVQRAGTTLSVTNASGIVKKHRHNEEQGDNWADAKDSLQIDTIMRFVSIYVDFVRGGAPLSLKGMVNSGCMRYSSDLMQVLFALPPNDGLLGLAYKHEDALHAAQMLYLGVLDNWVSDGTWASFQTNRA